jgi:hypothetical protein
MQASTNKLFKWFRGVFEKSNPSARKSTLRAATGDAAARGDEVTADSELLHPPRGEPQQAINFTLARGSIYNEHDIEVIVGHYWRYAPSVGIDPVVAFAQCVHETSERDPATGRWRPMSTWWAERPRRNPAGLGVTGEETHTPQADTRAWQQDTRVDPPLWRAGLAFESWDVCVRAQLGRLIAYALPEGAETPEQREMMDFALSFRPLSPRMRGTAPTLRQLGARHNPTGHGWATPGDRYGEKIAEIANAIRNS